VFDIAQAGDMILMPAMEGNPLVLVSEEQEKSMPADLQESFQSIVVGSAGELGAVLSGGYSGWSAYRDQARRHPPTEGGA